MTTSATNDMTRGLVLWTESYLYKGKARHRAYYVFPAGFRIKQGFEGVGKLVGKGSSREAAVKDLTKQFASFLEAKGVFQAASTSAVTLRFDTENSASSL